MATLIFVLLNNSIDSTSKPSNLLVVLLLVAPEDLNSKGLVSSDKPADIRLDICISTAQNIPADFELISSIDELRH